MKLPLKPEVDRYGSFIQIGDFRSAMPDTDTAAEIVQAVNEFPALVAALKQILADVGDRLTGKTVLQAREVLARLEKP